MPAVSVIIISHNKPRYVRQAINSVLNQTLQDWEGWLVDSGVLLNKGFFDDIKDSRLKIVASGEFPGQAKTTLMAGWCINNWLASRTPQGELIHYLCDDDYFYPRAFATFWNYYLLHDRRPQAMYASIDRGITGWMGQTRIYGQGIADQPAGKCCNGRLLDRQVDYLQFSHTRRILEEFGRAYGVTRYHSEDPKDTAHADGIFMEQVGALTPVHPIPELVGCNRRTPDSANAGLFHPDVFEHTTPGRIYFHVRRRLRKIGRRIVRRVRGSAS